MDLASHGCTQLSMNLLDHERTPLWRVWEAAAGMAEDEGVRLIDSELIGLAPTQALTDVADHVGVAASLPVEERLTEAAAWLRIRDFTPTMALELRLAQVRQGR
jgi:glutamate formiminotransferase